jgi:hypothetical protein
MIARSAPPLTIGALGVVTTVAYGACYYAFGVLVTPIQTDTGWSLAQLGAVFSLGLVVNGAVALVGGRIGTVLVAFLLACLIVDVRGHRREAEKLESVRDAIRAAWQGRAFRAWVVATLVGGAAADVMLDFDTTRHLHARARRHAAPRHAHGAQQAVFGIGGAAGPILAWL